MDAKKRNNRILVIDDNRAIHEDVRKILCPSLPKKAASLAALEAELLGASAAPAVAPLADFTVDSAYQGRDGLAMVQQALMMEQPYAMAFVDVRMPPGWDGIETTHELWKVAPDLQIVICTAYSDYSWEQMLAKLGSSDRLLILKKPFDTVEVLQLANALTEKWNQLQQIRANAEELERRVRERTADLQATNAALQQEITHRLQIEEDLHRAKNAAESADRAKSAFLANMSHEVRTPMNGVIGMANLLLKSPLTAEQRDLAETLCQSGEALLTIINDVLDFSKIEAGRLVLESIDFDLAEHLEIALDLHADAADRKNVELVMEIDPAVPRYVRGDPVRLRQIMLNLVGNAVKFTPKGEVVVRVAPLNLAAAGVGLRFEVSDSGIGITPEVQAALFKPFVQADSSTTRKYGGTGLGLAICKRLVELMSGEIGVSSAPNHGSTFWFTVGLEKAADAPAESEMAAAPSPLDGRRVLVVDDNATNRKLMAHLLTAWKAVHGAVDSGAAALEELRRAAAAGAPYELAVLDFHMPEMDGLQLAAAIRTERAIAPTLLVLLTSRGERLSADDMQKHGFSACELKPIHPEKLRLKLGRVLTHRPTAAPPETPNGATPGRLPHENASILVAEDNPVNQKVALLQLRNLGYAADVAANGHEVLSALRRHRYALVLMDEQMPEMDGIEATRSIRRAQAAGDPHFPANLRIVAMTANAMAGDREACLAAGMDDYLAKPLKLDALRKMLAVHLSVVSSDAA
ncbi:MAG TPA: response regulator [Opitutaceae bacterium]|nr:response regulator [Opitutaceae bacterium]